MAAETRRPSKDYEQGYADAMKEAIALCEGVRAHWASFHSVAPIAAAQCKSRLEMMLEIRRPTNG